jgi:hypothetical protein
MARRLHRRNTVLPVLPGCTRHHVNRPRNCIECISIPFAACGPPKAELARRSQRQPEYPVEMRFVAVPANTDARVVFGTEDLGDLGAWPTESLDALDHWREPWRDWIGLLQPPQRVIVPKAERCHTSFALILAKLEWLQGKGCDAFDQVEFRLGRDEFARVPKSLRCRRRTCKKGKLLGQGGPFTRCQSINLI